MKSVRFHSLHRTDFTCCKVYVACVNMSKRCVRSGIIPSRYRRTLRENHILAFGQKVDTYFVSLGTSVFPPSRERSSQGLSSRPSTARKVHTCLAIHKSSFCMVRIQVYLHIPICCMVDLFLVRSISYSYFLLTKFVIYSFIVHLQKSTHVLFQCLFVHTTILAFLSFA